jgi:hypothetical protein
LIFEDEPVEGIQVAFLSVKNEGRFIHGRDDTTEVEARWEAGDWMVDRLPAG